MTDEIKTHRLIDHRLCGVPLETGNGASRVEMIAVAEMAVDEYELIHGGFVFGLADHAAMIAVNDPHVVLGAADIRFIKPVKTGDKLVATATVVAKKGRKRLVRVRVDRAADSVFEGEFTCFLLDKHVLG